MVVLIGGYQHYISPHKGYSCAHRVRYGGHSCSEFARKVFADEGWWWGLAKLRDRFRACHAAVRSLRMERLEEGVRDADLDGPPGAGKTRSAGGNSTWNADNCLRDAIAECCCQGCGEACCLGMVDAA
jgi:Putative membrane protein insertion efficiency factor